jgi:hypothetical protein
MLTAMSDDNEPPFYSPPFAPSRAAPPNRSAAWVADVTWSCHCHGYKPGSAPWRRWLRQGDAEADERDDTSDAEDEKG